MRHLSSAVVFMAGLVVFCWAWEHDHGFLGFVLFVFSCGSSEAIVKAK